jgi:hypothetical protein
MSLSASAAVDDAHELRHSGFVVVVVVGLSLQLLLILLTVDTFSTFLPFFHHHFSKEHTHARAHGASVSGPREPLDATLCDDRTAFSFKAVDAMWLE